MAADAEALSRRLAAVDIDGVEAADKISFEIQESTRYFFLHPSATEPTKVKDQDAYKPYLLKVEQNVKAEYWAFLEDTSYGFPGWRSKKLKKYHIEPRFTPVESEDDERIMYDILDLRTGVSTDENFHLSLVIWKGSLCILYAAKNQYRREDDEPTLYSILPGMSMSEQWPDVADRGAEHVLFNYGYIGDRMNDMSAVKTLSSESTPPSLIRSVANPERRQMSSFKIDGHESQPLEDSVVPISTSQRSILDALQYDIEFIQGPPGTGKSTTIFHMVSTFVPSEECALVSCVSNKAIDSIAEKFAERLPFIVVGREERVGTTARQWTLEAQINRNPDVVAWVNTKTEFLDASKRLELVKDDSVEYQEKEATKILDNFESSAHSTIRQCGDMTRFRIGGVTSKAYTALFNLIEECLRFTNEELSKTKRKVSRLIRRACRAVLTTIDSCGSAVANLDTLDDEEREGAETKSIADRLSIAVLDEAGTIPEAKVCVVIANLRQITRIVAIGDQQQLEPFTNINRRGTAQTQGYFHRVARVIQLPMLNVQFRMHPQICELVSKIAYDNELRTDPDVRIKRLESSRGPVISWISYPMQGNQESEPEGKASSYINKHEIKLICDQVNTERSVLRQQRKNLLIITFYRGQLQLLREELADSGVLSRDKKSQQPIDPDDGSVRVTTVDSAQGSEADVVILSMVRSNPKCAVGFLANQNRAVVAISRAKDKLIIVGNEETVAARGLWRRVLNEANASGGSGRSITTGKGGKGKGKGKDKGKGKSK